MIGPLLFDQGRGDGDSKSSTLAKSASAKYTSIRARLWAEHSFEPNAQPPVDVRLELLFYAYI